MPATLDELLRAALAGAASPLLVYQIVVSLFVLFSLMNAIADGFVFRRPRPAAPDEVPSGGWPRLSVLIPARNEEATLEPCVRSLRAQGYPGDLEILILDDHSDDGTARVARELAATDRRVRVLAGGPLAPGWKGKPNALRQLAGAARGDLLLLTDADGDGSLVYAVRMYGSLRGIWDGFSKNLFPAMGKSLPVLIVWSLFLLTTQVLSAYLAYSGRGHAWQGRVYET